MKESEIIETFETSLITNIWVERNHIMILLMVGTVAAYVHPSLIQFFELLLGSLLFTDIFFLGFVGIAAHLQYFFRFEKNRKVELYPDRMIISIKGNSLKEICKTDIVKIELYDKLRNKIDRTENYFNAFPSFADPFYYLAVIDRNQERIILTCLLDIRLKKKLRNWYGQKLEHRYQFFPFPAVNNKTSLENVPIDK